MIPFADVCVERPIVVDPADEKQARSEKPDRTRHRLAVLKPMRAGETNDPEQVTDDLAVRVRCCVHLEGERIPSADARQLHGGCAFVLTA